MELEESARSKVTGSWNNAVVSLHAPTPRRVVIIDDHLTFARGLELLLNNTKGNAVEVKALTDDASAAAQIVEQHAAEVALVDLQMPPPGGMAAIASIAERVPGCATIVLSGVEDPEVATAALRAGALAFLVKSAEPEDLIPAILSVLAGMAVMPGWLRDHLINTPEQHRPDLSHLLDEDIQLLQLLADGADTAQIAKALHVSERTAKRMISGTLGRLGVRTRTEAAALATAAGVVVPSSARTP